MWQRCVLIALALTACNRTTATDKRPGVELRQVSTCLDGDATVGIGQFVLEDVDGNTIPASITKVTQTVDGDPPTSGKWEGGESLDEQDLESDLHVTLVLDASCSIAESAVFDDMKAAAVDLLAQGEELWSTRPGVFSWRILWFNDWVWEADDTWTLDDILEIPGPGEDADGFTRMYAGLDFAIDQADKLRKNGVANGDLDNHLMVGFTDGQDNSSGRDSPPVPFDSGTVTSGAEYFVHATKAITQQQTTNAIEGASPFMQTSMLALGQDVDSEVLEDFTEAGRGTVFSADDVGTLFEEAGKSFETVQYVGWRLPLNPGDKHKWDLEFKVEGLPKATQVSLDVSREQDTPVCEGK